MKAEMKAKMKAEIPNSITVGFQSLIRMENWADFCQNGQ